MDLGLIIPHSDLGIFHRIERFLNQVQTLVRVVSRPAALNKSEAVHLETHPNMPRIAKPTAKSSYSLFPDQKLGSYQRVFSMPHSKTCFLVARGFDSNRFSGNPLFHSLIQAHFDGEGCPVEGS